MRSGIHLFERKDSEISEAKMKDCKCVGQNVSKIHPFLPGSQISNKLFDPLSKTIVKDSLG